MSEKSNQPSPDIDIESLLDEEMVADTKDMPDMDSNAEKYIGFAPVEPDVTQTGCHLLDTCPRKYMLRSRFRLRRRGHKRSAALDIGNIWQILMAGRQVGWSQDQTEKAANDKITQIIKYAESLEDAGEQPAGYVDSVRTTLQKNLMMSLVMQHKFFQKYPINPARKVLAVEHRVRVNQQGIPGTCAGDLDLADFHETQPDHIFIVDNKSTSMTADERVQTIRFDLQLLMYRFLASAAWHDKKIVGVILNVCQKPTIEFSGKDRDFTETEHVLKSGPRKGETELRREYTGLPKYENYLKRCNDWYDCTGEYELEKDNRIQHPAILREEILLDGPVLGKELFARLRKVGRAATCIPDLDRFYRNSSACTGIGRAPCEYLPLCRTAPVAWKVSLPQYYERVPDEEKF